MPDKQQPEKNIAADRLAKEIGKRLSDARGGLGWSQQVLHNRTKMTDPEKVGVSRAVLSLYETGTNKPGAREIKILCDTLKVSPNWLLYGSESPARAIQPSSDFLRGSDINISARLAFAILALDPTDRDSLAQLVFSMVNKKIGDIRLSSLSMMANMLSAELMKEIVEVVGPSNKNLPLADMLDIFTREITEGVFTNYGNLRPSIPEDQQDSFDPDNPPPPRNLK